MKPAKRSSLEEIVDAFMAIARVLKSNLNATDKAACLPLAQIQVLQFISEQRQATMKALADFLSITPPSATALANGLVDLSYLHRGYDPSDRRTIHLKLTAKGAAALKKGMAERYRKLKTLLGKLNPAEQKQFIQLLNKLIP